MNTKVNLGKLGIATALIGVLATAYAFNPAQVAPINEEVIITTPLLIDEVDEYSVTAYTADDKYTVKAELDTRVFKDGNGFKAWKDVEVNEIKQIHVYDDHGEVQFYMDSLEVRDFKDQIEAELRKAL